MRSRTLGLILYYFAVATFVTTMAVMFKSCTNTKIYCGKIIKKYDATRVHKGNANAHPIFVIDWDQANVRTSDLEPTWTDYLTNEVGDKVCYKFQVNRMEGNFDYEPIVLLLGLVMTFVFGFFGAFLRDK